jgi:hypothetical protein
MLNWLDNIGYVMPELLAVVAGVFLESRQERL